LLFFGVFVIKEMYPRFRFDIAKRSLKLGLPVMLSAVFAMFYNLGDRFFIEKYSGLKVLAIYNLGMTIAGTITILSTSFQSIYAPIFFKEKNPAVNFTKVKEILRIALPVLSLLGAGLIFISWGMIRLNIINIAYREVLFLLPLLFISSIVQFATYLYINFMTYFEITYIIVFVNIISNIINIVLNICLIPKFSIYGAAFATVIATTIAFLAFFFYSKKRVKLAERAFV
jgi:O-antigen/teichoic acid export membrane protein